MAVQLSTPAYLKLTLHAAKYPHCPVNGLLVGWGSGADVLHVVDAVPLFHQHTLSPMLEAATMLVEQHCQSAGEQLSIVGYYHANERVGDTEQKALVRQIHAKVNENFSGAVLLMVQGDELADASSLALSCHWRGAKGTNELGKFAGRVELQDDGAKDELTQHLVGGDAKQRLMDFDEHFFDVSNDWRNPHLGSGR
eukprot:g4897.t1